MFLRVFFLLVSVFSVCLAQTEPYFYVKNKLNGLTSNQIYDLHFSKDGLLYIADDKGLSRYDGTVVTHFSFVSDQLTEVSNIMEAEDGNIFCKSFSNQIFKFEKDSLKKIVAFFSSLGFSPSSIHKNKLISLHNDKINFLDIKNLTSISVDIPLKINYQLISNPIFSCFIYENNTHYCVSVDSNFKINKNIITNRFVGAMHLSNQNIFSIYKKKNRSNILA